MIASDIPCPWGVADNQDLQGTKLSLIEKWYLGQQVATRNQRAKTLCIKYNLKKRTLQDYKKRYLYHLRTCREGGRPRCIDAEAQESIISAIKENPNISESTLRGLIRAKHKENWQLWHSFNPKAVYKKISKPSVWRYSKLLREIAM